MSVTPNPLTGSVIPKPQRRTLYCATILNNCGTWSTLEAWSEEELQQQIESGQALGWYGGTIREFYTREAVHPDEWKAYMVAVDHFARTTCPMPDEHDLKLRVEAKKLPAERWEEIDPSLAHGRKTQAYLERLKTDLLNEILRRAWLGESPTP